MQQRYADRFGLSFLTLTSTLPCYSFGERYLSTVLFNNLWSKDADDEAQMPSAWQKQSGEESTGGSSSEIIPKL